jgi:hypothetical protein
MRESEIGKSRDEKIIIVKLKILNKKGGNEKKIKPTTIATTKSTVT